VSRIGLAVTLALAVGVGCTTQGGRFAPREREPPSADRMDWGRSVFRFETFGNERFWSDVLGLADGLARRAITPNALLAIGVQLDSDRLPADFQRSDVGIGLYTDPRATRRVLEANAVIGLVWRRGRIGVTCALCHSRADDRLSEGVGRRVDGLPNTRLRVGELIAWGDRSRAYLPFLNLSGVGRGPYVDPAASVGDKAVARLERDVDAALLTWPPGQVDVIPDGVGNPTEIMPVFNLMDVGPYGWDGYFRVAIDAHNYFFSVVLDPTTLIASADGPAATTISPVPWDQLVRVTYDGVLSAIDPEMTRPRVAADRVGGSDLFRTPRAVAGFRVDERDLASISAYLARVLPPPWESIDDARVATGRRVFRGAGCNRCHLESRQTTGTIVPLGDLLPGYVPEPFDGMTTAAGVLREDPRTGYDDRVLVIGKARDKGYKVPQLVGIALTAPYLHDGSVASLEGLLSPERGDLAPHAYYVAGADDRADLVAFLRAWDGREYP
jgi:hypothetical protein